MIDFKALKSLSRGRFFGLAIASAAAVIAVTVPRPGRSDDAPYAKYRCTVCDHIYDEAVGDPPSGIAAGTRWANLPDDWSCPDCGAQKADFEKMAS